MKKGLLKSSDLKDVQIDRYGGTKKPTKPDISAVQRNSAGEIVCKGETPVRITAGRYPFLQCKTPIPPKHLNIWVLMQDWPEKTGQAQQDGSICMYTPLTDIKPAE